MAKFLVLAPEDDESTGYPRLVSEHTSRDKALDAARGEAKSIGRLASTVIVEEQGTANVWSVTYHPEPAVVSGTDPETGLPLVEWPCEFRITHDGREAETVEETSESGERLLTSGTLEGPTETWEE